MSKLGPGDAENEGEIDEIAARVKQGDLSAFEVIVRRYERPLRTWLAAHSQPGIDVDEVAQRTFVASYSNLSKYEIGTKFSAWLFTIARYQLQSEVTRLRRLTDYHSKFAPDLMQELTINAAEDSLSLWEVRLEHMRECLKQLSSGLQQFIKWRYEEQISIEQISEACGRSPAAVKKQLWLLRQKIFQCIQARMS
ncbi:MAG: sigma-70 family RNA polymerase sigma factor [Pirellulales bacterium]